MCSFSPAPVITAPLIPVNAVVYHSDRCRWISIISIGGELLAYQHDDPGVINCARSVWTAAWSYKQNYW